MGERTRIRADVETSILFHSARRCCLCFHLDNDFSEKEGQIAHLDRNAGNGVEDNLAFLCLPHHSLFDSTTSQHKNYTLREVKVARQRLYEEVKKRRPCDWVMVLDGRFSDFDKARIEAIVQHLRNVLGDAHLTIKRVDPGSVRLLIDSSEEAFDKVSRLVASGHLTELLGHTVQEVRKELASETESNCPTQWGAAEWRRLLISAAMAAAIYISILRPRAEWLLNLIHQRSGLPLLALQLSEALLVAVVTHYILLSKTTYRLSVAWYRWVSWQLLKRQPSAFFAGNTYVRNIRHYERAVTHCIRQSPFMYGVCMTGRSLIHGREKFALNALETLPSNHGKDIRFLFLDPDSEEWRARVRQVIQNDEKFSFERFEQESHALEQRLKRDGVRVASYTRQPSWKLYIFDDRVFVSRYDQQPQSENVLVFYRGEPLYDWLYSEFLSLCPAFWKDPIEAAARAARYELDHHEVQQEAHLVFEERIAHGVTGSVYDDWLEAEKRVRQRIIDEMTGTLLPGVTIRQPRK